MLRESRAIDIEGAVREACLIFSFVVGNFSPQQSQMPDV